MPEFADLLNKNWVRLEAFAGRVAQNPDDAGDLFQEASIRALRGFHSFEKKRSFFCWMCAIIVNTWADMYRKARARATRTISLEDLPDGGAFVVDASADLSRKLDAIDALRSVAALPPVIRNCVLSTALHGISDFEQAQLDGVGETTIRTRRCTARKKMKEYCGNT